MWREACHPERSEGSETVWNALVCVQSDNKEVALQAKGHFFAHSLSLPGRRTFAALRMTEVRRACPHSIPLYAHGGPFGLFTRSQAVDAGSGRDKGQEKEADKQAGKRTIGICLWIPPSDFYFTFQLWIFLSS